MKNDDRFYLTIYVPSYNRLENVKEILTSLILQCINSSDIQIIIQDNHSDLEYKNKLQEVLDNLPNYQCKIEINRNQSNIGMSANILKGFEIASSEWLWLLSDDDSLNLDAVKNLLDTAKKAPKGVDFIRFSSERSNVSKPQLIDSFDKFIESSKSVNDFNSYIFISNGIYRLSTFKKILEHGYIHSHTFVPHFMMLSNFMLNDGLSMISPLRIVNYEVPKIGFNYAMVAGLGVGVPKHILLNKNRKTAKDFHSIFYPHNDLKVLIDLYFQTKDFNSRYEFFYLATTYISYLRITRSWFWRSILICLVYLRFVPFGFETLVYLMKKSSKTAKKHIEEIKKRYD